IMPGVYTVSSPGLIMQPYIDIEGSGEKVTRITSALNSATYPPTVATVLGTDNAELRFLALENTATGGYATAMLNMLASPSMLHVTATVSGTALSNYCVVNYTSSYPTMTNVIATASGATSSNTGVINYSSSPVMTNVTATGSGGANSYGVANNTSSSPTMTSVTATASGGTDSNTGVFNNVSSSPTMTNMTVTASGGTGNNFGVSNRNASSPTMTNMTITASEGVLLYGVYNYASSPIMTHLIVTASGGTTASVGVHGESSGTIKINHSVIKAPTYSVYNRASVTMLIGSTQLDGGYLYNMGTASCAGVYNESYTFYSSSCTTPVN
ncbi:MAG: hypothetical protein J0653_04150, partial [Deltaproteobacteria bacterium]|nr:hypothetical protein [Deltaproteobacteria bacterium]